MKTSKAVFLSFIVGAAFCGMDSVAKSLITIQEFPETYADASFAQRIENETAGYDEWDSVYDENGNCISNCAYYGITLQEELDMMADAGAQLADDLAAEEQRRRSELPSPPTQPTQPAQPTQPTQPTQPPRSSGSYTCNTGRRSTHSNDSGFISPLDTNLVVTSVVGLRNVWGGSRVHRGIDFSAKKGTELYAAYEGVVEHAGWAGKGDSAGFYVRIKHTINGRTYYTFYMHMDEIKVKKGDHIAKGCFIGFSGGSGKDGRDSCVPHLHYEIRTTGDIAIDPLGSCIVKETPNLVPRELAGLNEKSKKRFKSLQSGNAIHTGKNFLSRPYCLRKWQTSPVVKACAKGTINLSQCFPDVTGWCSN